MKKYIIPIMNVVLILAIVGGLGFTLWKVFTNDQKAPTTDQTAVSETGATRDEAPTEAELEHFRVGVVQHATAKPNDYCYQGFVDQLKQRGLLSGVDVTYVVENDDEKCIAEIQRLVDEGCDLLYAIGPFAAKNAAAITDEIPIVFAAVTDPEEAGLVESNEVPGGNVTGVSSYTPCFEQIDLIPVILPEAKSIAAIYHSTDENSARQAIIATKEAKEFDYSAELYPVGDEKQIKDALEKIKKNGTDVIFLPNDKLITKYLDTLTAFSFENGIPIICAGEDMLSSGCLATCRINYTSVGRKSADLACEILYGKKDPASLSVIYKYDCYNLVNRQAMEKLGIKLSATALRNVELVDTAEDETEAATEAATEADGE